MKARYLFWGIAIWLAVFLASLGWNNHVVRSSSNAIALNKAQSFFSQMVVTRSWNSGLGGVYALLTESTPSNPYLIDPLRDVTTTLGLQLTKINPAYMTRQISEIQKYQSDVRFHITSLNPLRPANKADAWENEALIAFESGQLEVFELVKGDSAALYRYMAPLTTERSCLQCHAEQGYKYGDVRGGISVSFPAKPYLDAISGQIKHLLHAHLLIFLLGLMGMLGYFYQSRKYLSIIVSKNADLERNEALLQKANGNLAMLNSKKDMFFSVIAHDLRNPFTVLVGFSEILLDEIETIDKQEATRLLTAINKTSTASFILLENLMEWSLSELELKTFNPQPLGLCRIVNESIQLVEASASSKAITIANKIPEEATIIADSNMLAVILRNLLTNAIKFSYEGGKVEISANYDDKGLTTVAVQDYGVGMSKEQVEKLFNIEKIESTSGTHEEKGTGLGLILCQEYILKHAGKIWAESEKGKGSRFIFSIPYKQASDPSA